MTSGAQEESNRRGGTGHPGVNLSSHERWTSAGAGAAFAALAVWGLLRRRFWGIPLAMIGAGLAWRGITGHCDIYTALGIDHAEKTAPALEEGKATGSARARESA
jgi:uncharacterized protein (TIGR03382 family)